MYISYSSNIDTRTKVVKKPVDQPKDASMANEEGEKKQEESKEQKPQ